MRSRQHLAIILALTALAATTPPASAQEDGHGGAAPAEAPEQAIEPAMEFTSRDKSVSVMLPKNWKSERVDDARGEVAKFIWPQGEGAIALLSVTQETAQMRAGLAEFGMSLGREVVEGSRKSGDGYRMVTVRDEANRRALHLRFDERDGIVWQTLFVSPLQLFDEQLPVAEAALASIKISGEYEPPTVPKGWAEEKVKDFVMWSDADEDNLDAAEDIVESFLDIHKLAGKTFDGDPFDESPPIVQVIQNGTVFEDVAVAATGRKPEDAAYDPKGRSLLIKWMSRNTQGFEHSSRQWAAQQQVHKYFGGNVPLWLSGGLRMYLMYGADDGGKPQKPDKDRMETVVKPRVAAASRKLDAWLTATSSDVTDMNVGFTELYAWHWFFRHGREGRKYRKTYEDCLETLRATGDVEAAHAVWDGTDFGDMFDAFKEWGSDL